MNNEVERSDDDTHSNDEESHNGRKRKRRGQEINNSEKNDKGKRMRKGDEESTEEDTDEWTDQLDKYSLTKGDENDENKIKEIVKRIQEILNKSDIQITKNNIIRRINFGVTKYVLGIDFMNIGDQDCELLSQLVEIIMNIKRKNNECKVCSEKGHYTKECIIDQ